ncbi:lactococcin 972 family bacteriocin [Lactobacillus apis]|uniref:lactococcin 972 family bacteriocin n=1 Tax=Lactobacillus apis TaxID=303541 RepID=UPI00242E36C5|nr:lactococcin 972 family bacteriocin [Lactobacillus apis]
MSKKLTIALTTSLLSLGLVPATIAAADVAYNGSSSNYGGYVELSTNDTSAPVQFISSKGYSTRGGGAGLAPYKWHHKDGGEWLFGVYGTKVQSTYKHNRRNHTTTAKNGDGNGRRDYARAGATAFSQVNATFSGNKAYYGFY